ncbi:hypothetical protein CDAR_2641 [Caerostris darwini]|uniref:Uncharacterized protein n=1 Tax=Caerostris darwini TaxID=1538125 RepID=A0AAV4MZP1_9ARAC|nr:hypothetical protein CDAR_2641 [Caerostris darwini]
MAEESDLDLSTLQTVQDDMDLDCESLVQALEFYNKIVEHLDGKELKKKAKNLVHVNALAIVKIVASQNTYIAQLEGRLQEMEKNLTSKSSVDQAQISAAVAKEVEKRFPDTESRNGKQENYCETHFRSDRQNSACHFQTQQSSNGSPET